MLAEAAIKSCFCEKKSLFTGLWKTWAWALSLNNFFVEILDENFLTKYLKNLE